MPGYKTDYLIIKAIEANSPAESLAHMATVQEGLARIKDVDVRHVQGQVLLERGVLRDDEDTICGDKSKVSDKARRIKAANETTYHEKEWRILPSGSSLTSTFCRRIAVLPRWLSSKQQSA